MQSILNNIAEVAGMLWQKGWAERNGGNITVNITSCLTPDQRQQAPIAGPYPIGVQLHHLSGSCFYAKGTGKRMRDLARSPMDNGSIIRIDADGAHYHILADKPVMPTSELPSHLQVHDWMAAEGIACTATLHTHPIELVALSHLSQMLDSDRLTQLLWSMIPETLAFAPRGIGVVPYTLPGSSELAAATLQQIMEHDVVLWEKHGVFAIGEDIIEAFDQVDVLNKAAQIYLAARSTGNEPQGMTSEAIQQIQQIFNLPLPGRRK